MKKNKKIILEIEKIVTGGYGLAHDKTGQTYMVRGAIAGELVSVNETSKKKNIIFASVVDVLRESEHRVEPFCPYYGTCGGCVFQHISYEEQVNIKKELLADSIQRLGGISDPLVASAVKSNENKNYRISVTFKVQDGKVGFFQENSNDLVVVDYCPIINDAVNNVIPRLNDFAKKYKTIEEIRCLYSPEKGDLILDFKTTNKINNPNFFDKIVNRHHIKGISLTRDAKTYTRRGEDSTTIKENNYMFRVHVRSFIQNNPNVYDGFYSTTSKYLRRNDGMCLDLYSGIGFFTMLLAEYFNTVVGVEADYFSYRNSLKNRNRNCFNNIHLVNATVEDPELLEKIPLKEGYHFDYVLVDPPRSGLTKEAAARIKEFLPEKLIYVSCEASTLARDIKRLAPHYNFVETNLIDSFPYTKHIESISLFERNEDRPREKLKIKAEHFGLK